MNATTSTTNREPLFERVVIRAIHPTEDYPVDFELKAGVSPDKGIQWLKDHGYEPASSPASVTVTPATPNADEENFSGDLTIVGSVLDGKVFWSVRGGQFAKFGVRIWPEVLEAAGFDPEQMNPIKPIAIKGTAYFVNKANGQPKKITRLLKA